MSRIGKLPVIIPSNVEVSITENTVLVKGPKGELQIEYKPLVKITLTDNEVQVNPVNETKEARSMHGLYRSLISNMVTGVTNGYEKRLEIQGVGYRVKKIGTNAVKLPPQLGSIGFSMMCFFSLTTPLWLR